VRTKPLEQSGLQLAVVSKGLWFAKQNLHVGSGFVNSLFDINKHWNQAYINAFFIFAFYMSE